MATRKILVSPGYGAGWTTWNYGEAAKFMLTYKPIIDHLEAGNDFSLKDCGSLFCRDSEVHPLLKELQEICQEKFGERICILGADDLKVYEVEGQVRITEYDGSESFVTRAEDNDWM
jgi:hypothetical protein